MQQPVATPAVPGTYESLVVEPRRSAEDPRPALAALIGADFSGRAVTTSNADKGPGHIRAALAEHDAADLVRGLDLSPYKIVDHGNAHAFNNDWTNAWGEIITLARAARDTAPFLVALGGDQSVSWPLMTVAAERATRLGIVHVDAQRDMQEARSAVTDRNVMRGVLEHGLVQGTDLVQLGLNRFANDLPTERIAHDHGVVGITIDQLRADGVEAAVDRALWSIRECDSVWLSVDIECLDRSFAPGSTNAFAGGFLPSELEVIVDRVCGYPATVGMDVVELDPVHDVREITAHHAARLVMVALSARAARLRGADASA